ncbi:hypothetical protein FBU59_002270, partial [Linderina macrospora]
MLFRSLITSSLALASVAFAAPIDTTTDSTSDATVETYNAFVRPSMIVFGDSMSDNGNMPHYSNYSQYWGGRYSNSYMWNEYTAFLTNMKLENYAIGGSTTDNSFVPAHGRTQLIPSVTDMVQQYIANNTNVSKFKKQYSLVFMDGGGNDIGYSADGLSNGSIDPTWFVTTLVANQMANIKRLLDAGYRNIYLINYPDAGGRISAALTGSTYTPNPIISAVNNGFKSSLAALKKSRSDASNVNMLDVDSMMTVILNADVLKAMNITSLYPPCADYSTNGEQPVFCSDPDTRFLYDPSHPSGRIEYILG